MVNPNGGKCKAMAEPSGWLVSDKTVLWHDSGNDMPHTDHRAGLVALGKVAPLTVALKYFTQHPTLVLKVFSAVWQVWVHPCVKSRLHWDSTACG